jgi:hypothetical protein
MKGDFHYQDQKNGISFSTTMKFVADTGEWVEKVYRITFNYTDEDATRYKCKEIKQPPL